MKSTDEILTEYQLFLQTLTPHKTVSSFLESLNHIKYCRCLFLPLFNNCRSFSWKHSSRPILMPNAPWRSVFVKVLSIWLQEETRRAQGGNVNFNKPSIAQSFGHWTLKHHAVSDVWFIGREFQKLIQTTRVKTIHLAIAVQRKI